MKFVVVGATCMDVLLPSVPRLPHGSSGVDEFTDASLVHVDRPPVITIGGNGGNTSVALASLGARVRLVTTWGSDVAGAQVARWLGETTCEVVDLRLHPSTALNVTANAADGTRLTFFHGPGFGDGRSDALVGACACTRGDVLLLTGYPHPSLADMATVASTARDAGARVALDIGPAVAGFDLQALQPLLPYLDLLFCNESELLGLLPGQPAEEVLRRVARQVRGGVVVKRGPKGAAYRAVGGTVEVDTVPIEDVSTVGAGDVFDAGFLHAWAAGAEPREALRAGCATATETLRRGGDVLSLPRHERHEPGHERTVD